MHEGGAEGITGPRGGGEGGGPKGLRVSAVGYHGRRF